MLAARDRLVAKYGDIRPPAVVEVPFDTLGVSEQDFKDIGILLVPASRPHLAQVASSGSGPLDKAGPVRRSNARARRGLANAGDTQRRAEFRHRRGIRCIDCGRNEEV
jgi:hypothetical protein